MTIDQVLEDIERQAEFLGVPILRKAERDIFVEEVKKANPAWILEVGTAIGYSALLMAKACPRANIVTIEKDYPGYCIAVETFQKAGVAGRVFAYCGDAAEELKEIEGPYDLLYLDGPKGQYLKHLKLAEPLLSPHATVITDNVLFRGLVEGNEKVPHRYRTIVNRLRDYISYIKENYDTRMYPEGDGLAVSVKRT